MTRYILLLTAMIMLALTGCKTSEANYRAAYEKAKNKGQSEAVDPEVYQKIAQEEGPATLTVGGISFPGRAMYLSSVPVENVPNGKIDKYSVTTAKFKQTFNARMMAKRLAENGFADAFVTRDRDDNYYVIAMSTDNLDEALQALDKLKGLQVGANAPFPYVIVRP